MNMWCGTLPRMGIFIPFAWFLIGEDMKKRVLMAVALLLTVFHSADACTGITLRSADGATVLARTIEWGGSYLASQYVVVPRGYEQRSFVSGGKKEGLCFKSRYGYVGIAVEAADFVAEGINEEGLSAGLFYFPKYGSYEEYRPENKETSLSDLQLVSWVLGNFRTVEEVKGSLQNVHIVSTDPRASTVHWRFADTTGKQVVLEIIDGKLNFYENRLGVLTNSPGFEWQLTNLNNYVNLFPGAASDKNLGSQSLSAFGAGSGMLGLPGDVTPPSRFVRAAFYQTTAPIQPNARRTALQAFQILNNFDIPPGVEFADGKVPVDIPSATQWTSATDVQNRLFYFTSMYDRRIRLIDLKTINFARTHYRAVPIDAEKEQTVTPISLK